MPDRLRRYHRRVNQVDFISGKTRMFGIVGDPIVQVRSPEMITWELHRRGVDAVLVPVQVPAAQFESVMPALMRLANFDGFVLTIPFKTRALAFADRLGLQAQVLGAVNLLVRRPDGHWSGDMFDGMGCVAAFEKRAIAIEGRRLMIMGLGGAGGAIACAMAARRPQRIRLHDLSAQRCEFIKSCIARISPATAVEAGPPTVEGMDVLINATPVGMLDDARLPLVVQSLPPSLVVFDAIVMPEQTPLLALAEQCGCSVVRGREMMLGQIPRLVDGLLNPDAVG
jgi:shikimate dehydrogenase